MVLLSATLARVGGLAGDHAHPSISAHGDTATLTMLT